MKKVFLLYIIICGLSSFVFAQQQPIKTCKAKNVKGGKYKKISHARPLKGDVDVLLDILVKPKNFNKIYMTKLAKRIKSVYCNENAVFTRVFDSYKSAALYFDINYSDLNEKNEYEMVRGFYSFDREENKDILEFSKKLGNPTTEVQIDLSENNSKVSQRKPGEDPIPCTNRPTNKGKYKILSIGSGVELQFYIRINRKYRTEKNYIVIAKEFKEKYCTERYMRVIYSKSMKHLRSQYVTSFRERPLAIFYTSKDKSEGREKEILKTYKIVGKKVVIKELNIEK